VRGSTWRQPEHPGGQPDGLGVAPRAKRDHKPEQQIKILEREALLKLTNRVPEQ
jgi:hypothetical protein